MEKNEMRDRIIDAAARLFNEKGVRFTMDEIARDLSMSKKTIYTIFPDKRSLMIETIDRYFAMAGADQDEILKGGGDVIAKLRDILALVPAQYENIDLRHVHLVKEKYPGVYRHWKVRREEYWDKVAKLLSEGMDQGVIRKVRVPVLRTMYQSSIEQFFQKDILIKNDISYKEALDEVAEIMISGIINKADS